MLRIRLAQLAGDLGRYSTALCAGLLCIAAQASGAGPGARAQDSQPVVVTNFHVAGVLRGIEEDGNRLLIAHDAVPGYMPAMTMPFRLAAATNESVGLRPGDHLTFDLHVGADSSWLDHVVKTASGPAPRPEKASAVATAASIHPHHPLLDYAFTNELGQPVRLADFRGQALAITFFFTRCPIPDFCPRLSRNFEEVSRRLEAMTNGPANWHLLSITFDPEHDTPAALRAYGRSYQYDPRHWSFITGPTDKIRELAALSGVTVEPENGGLLSHNFRTLIIDANWHLQMVFPFTGDFSDSIVSELLKAAAVTNHS